MAWDDPGRRSVGLALEKNSPGQTKSREGQMAWPGFFGLAWPGHFFWGSRKPGEKKPVQAKWPGLVFAGLAWPGHFFWGDPKPGQMAWPGFRRPGLAWTFFLRGAETRPKEKPGQASQNQAGLEIQASWPGLGAWPGFLSGDLLFFMSMTVHPGRTAWFAPKPSERCYS